MVQCASEGGVGGQGGWQLGGGGGALGGGGGGGGGGGSVASHYKLKIDALFEPQGQSVAPACAGAGAAAAAAAAAAAGACVARRAPALARTDSRVSSVHSSHPVMQDDDYNYFQHKIKQINNTVQDRIEKMFADMASESKGPMGDHIGVHTFNVHYLGSTSLNQKVSSLAGLQDPLRDLYFAYKKNCKHKCSLTGKLEISKSGLKVRYKGDRGDLEQLNPFPTIAVWSAVKFVVQASEKDNNTLNYAFLPLITDPDNIEKHLLFKKLDQVDKKYILSHSENSHSPIFAVVMRKIGVAKQLECHGFVCQTSEDAIVIAATLYKSLMSHMNRQNYEDPSKKKKLKNRNGVSCMSTASSYQQNEVPTRPPRKKRSTSSNSGDSDRPDTAQSENSPDDIICKKIEVKERSSSIETYGSKSTDTRSNGRGSSEIGSKDRRTKRSSSASLPPPPPPPKFFEDFKRPSSELSRWEYEQKSDIQSFEEYIASSSQEKIGGAKKLTVEEVKAKLDTIKYPNDSSSNDEIDNNPNDRVENRNVTKPASNSSQSSTKSKVSEKIELFTELEKKKNLQRPPTLPPPIPAKPPELSSDSKKEDLRRNHSIRRSLPETGDILTKVAIPRSGSFLNAGGLTRYKSIGHRNNGKKSGGSPLGFHELFNEFRIQENLHSMDEILNAIIDAEGMSFNDLKPIYKEFLLKLAVTLTKDEIFQHSKAIMKKQKKKIMRRNSTFQNKRKKMLKGAGGLRLVFRLPFGKDMKKQDLKNLEFRSLTNRIKTLQASESSVSTSSYDLRQFRPKEPSVPPPRRPTLKKKNSKKGERMHVSKRGKIKSGERNSASEDSDFFTLSNRVGWHNRNSSSGYVSCSECESVDKCYCSCGRGAAGAGEGRARPTCPPSTRCYCRAGAGTGAGGGSGAGRRRCRRESAPPALPTLPAVPVTCTICTDCAHREKAARSEKVAAAAESCSASVCSCSCSCSCSSGSCSAPGRCYCARTARSPPAAAAAARRSVRARYPERLQRAFEPLPYEPQPLTHKPVLRARSSSVCGGWEWRECGGRAAYPPPRDTSAGGGYRRARSHDDLARDYTLSHAHAHAHTPLLRRESARSSRGRAPRTARTTQSALALRSSSLALSMSVAGTRRPLHLARAPSASLEDTLGYLP